MRERTQQLLGLDQLLPLCLELCRALVNAVLELGVDALELVLDALALADVEHEADRAQRVPADGGRADDDRKARPVQAEEFLFIGVRDARLDELRRRALIGGRPFGRGSLAPPDPARLEILARHAEHVEEGIVGLGHDPVVTRRDDADDAGPLEVRELGLGQVQRALEPSEQLRLALAKCAPFAVSHDVATHHLAKRREGREALGIERSLVVAPQVEHADRLRGRVERQDHAASDRGRLAGGPGLRRHRALVIEGNGPSVGRPGRMHDEAISVGHPQRARLTGELLPEDRQKLTRDHLAGLARHEDREGPALQSNERVTRQHPARPGAHRRRQRAMCSCRKVARQTTRACS